MIRGSSIDDNDLSITKQRQPNDDIFSYILHVNNKTAVRLANFVMMDRLPNSMTLVGATIPPESGAIIYYLTDDDGTLTNGNGTMPTLDITNPAGTGASNDSWSTTKPAIVRWVAVHTPCLPSAYFPTTEPSCSNVPSTFDVTLQVRMTTPALPAACQNQDISNYGRFYLTQHFDDPVTGTTISNFAPSELINSPYSDEEQTHVGPRIADFSESTITGDNIVATGTSNIYTLNVKNTGSDAATSVNVKIPKIQIEANGVLKAVFVDSIIASGGTISGPDVNGAYTIAYTTINAGEERSIQVTLRNPVGVLDQKTFRFLANITGSDNQCGSVGVTLNQDVTVQGLPVLRLFKSRSEGLIAAGDSIHYKLTATNPSITPTRRAIAIDSIPSKTIFERAYTATKVGSSYIAVSDDVANSYLCRGCQVYFSDKVPPLPTEISTTNIFDDAMINNLFQK
jgi:uncharacterized repeat protein (TIGR01451 family)